MIGSTELFLILVIVVVVFGAGKLPEVGGAIGRSLSEFRKASQNDNDQPKTCLLYTSPSPRDRTRSRMPSSA